MLISTDFIHLQNCVDSPVIQNLFPHLTGITTDAQCCCRYAKDADCKLLQDFLVEEVLFKIVWCQYANAASRTVVENFSQVQHSASAVTKSAPLRPVLPPQVLDEVASMIIDILVVLGQDEGVLVAYWPGFQTACVDVLLDTSSENDTRLSRLERFFSLLDMKIAGKEKPNNPWLLLNVVQPFVSKAFPALKNSVSLFPFLRI